MLAKHFSRIYSNKYLKPVLEFDTKAMDKLLQYHYPGNIRELHAYHRKGGDHGRWNALQSTDLIFSPIESSIVVDSEPNELS